MDLAVTKDIVLLLRYLGNGIQTRHISGFTGHIGFPLPLFKRMHMLTVIKDLIKLLLGSKKTTKCSCSSNCNYEETESVLSAHGKKG